MYISRGRPRLTHIQHHHTAIHNKSTKSHIILRLATYKHMLLLMHRSSRRQNQVSPMTIGFWPGLRAMEMVLMAALSSVSDLTVNEVGAKEEERRPMGAMLAADEMGERMAMRPLLDTAACKSTTARITLAATARESPGRMHRRRTVRRPGRAALWATLQQLRTCRCAAADAPW